mmetsp:Transcript_1399/g.3013  ORF Transcript_1399/g.3013 Transcript_1399/m.3013 type:complete len:121 (+) Transcript_1399:290-652(+)
MTTLLSLSLNIPFGAIVHLLVPVNLPLSPRVAVGLKIPLLPTLLFLFKLLPETAATALSLQHIYVLMNRLLLFTFAAQAELLPPHPFLIQFQALRLSLSLLHLVLPVYAHHPAIAFNLLL